MGDQITSYRDLLVWQKAVGLAELCYAATKSFPKDERYGLTSQLRRSAVSVSANIAEGYGRDSKGAYVQFLRIAQGSLKEFETLAIIACRIGALPLVGRDELLAECNEIGRMLRALIRSIERTAP